jgi:hypothetical protein
VSRPVAVGSQSATNGLQLRRRPAVANRNHGNLSLTGDSLSVPHDIGSAVTTDSTAARPFVGGKIELAIADVSGDHYVDHEKEVLAYIARD